VATLSPLSAPDSTDSAWRQGMKGLVINLTNNKIYLGNNAAIEGYQTQYYPG
jgi:hypothetical protein